MTLMTTSNLPRRSNDQVLSLMERFFLTVFFMVCRILSLTWRVRFFGMDRRRMAVSSSPGKGFLLGTFHENAFASTFCHANQNLCNMVSQSKDGEITAFLMEKLGQTTVRGSSSRGGKAARDGMIRSVMEGAIGGITVDGPRGPRRQLKKGIVDIARKTGAPILPMTAYGETSWILKKTWDQTRIPKPFSRVIVYYGEPIHVPKDIGEDRFGEYITKITDVLSKEDDLVRLRFSEIWPSARPWSKP